MSVLEVKNLNFHYRPGLSILEGLNFKVEPGDFLGLIGPNGGGKTTLLKIILGLLEPNGGSVEVLGKSPKEARAKIGYVPQYSKIDLNYPINVWETVLTGRLGEKKFGQGYTKQDKKIAEDSLRLMGIWEQRKKSFGQLSGGQRQRLLIARALVREPELLILDEPTNNVDSESGKDFYEALKELNDQGTTIIIVSHDLVAISAFVSKVICLNKKMTCHDHPGVCLNIVEEGYDSQIRLLHDHKQHT